MNNPKFICNAFSLQMLDCKQIQNVHIQPMCESDFEKIKNNIPSAIGHQDTANVLGVQCNRVNVSLNVGDSIIVVQLLGGRLPEGCTTLPEGFKFVYLLVTIEDSNKLIFDY